jgi:hypothetical protein
LRFPLDVARRRRHTHRCALSAERASKSEEGAFREPRATAGAALPKIAVVRGFELQRLHGRVDACWAEHGDFFAEQERDDFGGVSERPSAHDLSDFRAVEEEAAAVWTELDDDARSRLEVLEWHRHACRTSPHQNSVTSPPGDCPLFVVMGNRVG